MAQMMIDLGGGTVLDRRAQRRWLSGENRQIDVRIVVDKKPRQTLPSFVASKCGLPTSDESTTSVSGELLS
jgi:hypothetical protein